MKPAIAAALVLCVFFSLSAEAQKNRVPEKLDDLQRVVNAVRIAQKAGVDDSDFQAKLARAGDETIRFANDDSQSTEVLQVGLAYVIALGIYDDAEKVRIYLNIPNVYLHKAVQLSKLVDKYDLPTELVRGTDNRRVRSEALPKMWRLASEKLDKANELLLKNYKETINAPNS